MAMAINKSAACVALVFASAWIVGPVASQPIGGDRMMGPGMMGRGMMGAGLCDPRAAGLAEWRSGALERAVRPTDAQRASLDALKAASTKAAETIASACPRDLPRSPIERLDVMEKRLTTMLDALRIVRPAFENFYNTLTDDQKAKISSVGPRRWGWGEGRWRWNR
jgi:hypothetical protein